MKTSYLIDASPYVFRAYYSIPATMHDGEGNPANAVYGFTTFLCQFLEQAAAQYVAVAFDGSLTTSFRNDFYAAYKQQRELPPPELERQFAACKSIAAALGLATFISDRYEADDLIGTIAKSLRTSGFRNVILSNDKDLAQLIEGDDVYWDFARDRRLDASGIVELFGVAPSQVVDFLALAGDAVDNIPGVRGIGKKTAAVLLQHFQTLEQLYAGLDEVPGLKIRGAARVAEVLREQREAAFLSQRLARIATDAPVDGSPESIARGAVDYPRLMQLFDGLRFGSGIRERVQRLK